MLTQLTMNNFALIENLTLDYHAGFTAITGETGAGKSISLDAINLCLGARAESNLIQNGANRADVSAHFLLDDMPSALNWLKDEQLDEGNECLIRRVINQDGRSKSFINGQAVTLTQLKSLGKHLIQIHGQHDYQRLLDNHYQQQLLDNSLNQPELFQRYSDAFKKWKNTQKQLQQKKQAKQEAESKIQLLQYQIDELDEFAPIIGEFEKIEEEYNRLANSEQLQQQGEQLIDLIGENDSQNILKLCHQAQSLITSMQQYDPNYQDIKSMIEQATIQLEEAQYSLKNYLTDFELDAHKIAQLNQRLTKQIALARKHNVKPAQLPDLYLSMKTELDSIKSDDIELELLEQTIELSHQEAFQLATEIHKKRIEEAASVSAVITTKIKSLSMPHAQFEIQVNWIDQTLTESGANQVIFMVSTNPGQPLQPMAKIASGGELSRIALAIQVLIAKKREMPALIFDEIDSGISGLTAAKVGKLLNELGKSTQVITVTHLPQVAGYANQHYFVSKATKQNKTTTSIQLLEKEGRIKELARLLSGDKVTEVTLANAKELLVV